MATVSSHVLDSVHGFSAAGVRVSLTRLNGDGSRDLVFESATDDEGRISETVSVNESLPASYELEFQTGAYFLKQQVMAGDDRVMPSIIVRIEMVEAQKRYHIPIMAGPHSYSVWWSR